MVEKQQFRHEWPIIMYENTQRFKNKGHSITCSHIWHVDISTCVYWLATYFVKVWWRCVLPNANNAVHFCDIFFRHMAVLPTCPTKRSRKLEIRLIKNQLKFVYINGLFWSKVFFEIAKNLSIKENKKDLICIFTLLP